VRNSTTSGRKSAREALLQLNLLWDPAPGEVVAEDEDALRLGLLRVDGGGECGAEQQRGQGFAAHGFLRVVRLRCVGAHPGDDC